jgi:hypothetical protein
LCQLISTATFDLVNVPLFNGVYKQKYQALTTTQTYTIDLALIQEPFALRPGTTVTVNAAPDVIQSDTFHLL